ncbi:PrgI family protein [Bifidobacterium tissieri]|uniref:PrgI family protein n=1 Tax=Bifidobacterium tissieri TaxID=1630162 RepID=UPI00123C6548|nr:PrgI family protein [Bifidobacterium tissieri]KAA8830170.1 PrgI family protein [Bifidobacterium tissieri]
MTLEIKVHKEITATEAKVMWGLSWRQMAAAAVMCGLSAGLWLLFRNVLHAPEVGQYVVMLVDAPIAVWGWLRPKGLKPEVWLRYVLSQRFGQQRFFIDGPARQRDGKRDRTIQEKGHRS